MIEVRPLAGCDGPWKREALITQWGETAVARRAELVDADQLDGFVALVGEERVGLLTLRHEHPELEIVTIQAAREGVGIGRALMDAARHRAEALGVERLWLMTTNNNVRALAFYQRWGMDLVALHPNEVERSRALKPSIPLRDAQGRPIRDELELEVRFPT